MQRDINRGISFGIGKIGVAKGCAGRLNDVFRALGAQSPFALSLFHVWRPRARTPPLPSLACSISRLVDTLAWASVAPS